MKILLIYPPDKHMITTNIPSVVDEERGYNPPLGIMYVAGYAEKYTDHNIEVLDAVVEELNYESIKEEIKRRKPDLVGIEAVTFTLLDTIMTAKMVKEVDEDIPVVLGGPHVSIFPEETIDIPDVDYVVLGEGEQPFTELIQNLDNEHELKNVKGLVFKDGNEIINTGQREFIEDLDSIPFPARHLTHYKKYYSLLAKRSPITTMMTSRGCPHRCVFCDRPHLGKRFRARSAENVMDEMEECVNMGINEFLIYDDTFTVNRKRVVNICNEIIERGWDIGWDIRARVDTVDKELLKLMKKAGCERIHYGVESANPEILRVLRKNITIDQVQKAFKWTNELEITTLAYFIIGSAGETREQIIYTIEFAKKLNPDFVHFSVMTPFPATELYRIGLENGILKNDYWREFAENPTDDFVPQLWDELLSQKELTQLLKYAYKSFYTRPSYIAKRLLKVRSLEEFKRKAKAGIKVFKL